MISESKPWRSPQKGWKGPKDKNWILEHPLEVLCSIYSSQQAPFGKWTQACGQLRTATATLRRGLGLDSLVKGWIGGLQSPGKCLLGTMEAEVATTIHPLQPVVAAVRKGLQSRCKQYHCLCPAAKLWSHQWCFATYRGCFPPTAIRTVASWHS